MEDAVDTKPYGFIEGQGDHVDKAGNVYQKPIAWYGQVGLGPIEIYAYPEGVVGKATLAKAEKAKGGLVDLLDYIVDLHDAILEKFPPGELPPIEQVTQREREEIEDVLRGPLRGGRHIYTLAYPP